MAIGGKLIVRTPTMIRLGRLFSELPCFARFLTERLIPSACRLLKSMSPHRQSPSARRAACPWKAEWTTGREDRGALRSLRERPRTCICLRGFAFPLSGHLWGLHEIAAGLRVSNSPPGTASARAPSGVRDAHGPRYEGKAPDRHHGAPLSCSSFVCHGNNRLPLAAFEGPMAAEIGNDLAVDKLDDIAQLSR